MKGFALLEVLITLLLISLGLLGIMAMQLSALHTTQSAYLQSLASSQLASMLDRLRANLSQTARDNELQLWTEVNNRLLPKSISKYSCVDYSCSVELNWFDQKLQHLSLTSLLPNDIQ